MMFDKINSFLEKLDDAFEDDQSYIQDEINKTINYILEKALQQGKVAIVGDGSHTERMITDYKQLCDVDIIDKKYSFDSGRKRQQHNLRGYDCIHDYDCLIVGSKRLGTEIKEQIDDYGFDGEVVDIYQELESYGLRVPNEYYKLREFPYIIEIVGRTKLEKNPDDIRCLGNIIYEAIHNRDFGGAKDYLNTYKIKDQKKSDYVEDLVRSIEAIEEEIKRLFQAREKRDIVAFWIDGLRYELSKKMQYLNECRKAGIDFEHAYSSTYSTRDTYGCILHDCDEIDLYTKRFGKYRLLESLEQNGYAGYRVNGSGSIPIQDFNIKEDEPIIYNVSSAQIMWDTMMQVLTSDIPVFCVCHVGLETHGPYISPWSLKWDRCTVAGELFKAESEDHLLQHLENAKVSAAYCDKQLQYFSNLMGDGIAKIYFSDHGAYLKKQTAQYMDDMMHVPFVVTGPDISSTSVKTVILTRHMREIVEWIIEKQEWSEGNVGRDYVCVYGIDAYNPKWIQSIIEYDLVGMGVQYNGVRTNKDLYIIDALGEEKYYIYPEHFENRIKDPQCQDRIQYLKGLLIEKHIDITTHPKFFPTLELYKGIGKKFMWEEEK